MYAIYVSPCQFINMFIANLVICYSLFEIITTDVILSTDKGNIYILSIKRGPENAIYLCSVYITC